MYLIVEACMKLKRTKFQEILSITEWTRDKKLSDKTGGANNSNHDCMYMHYVA